MGQSQLLRPAGALIAVALAFAADGAAQGPVYREQWGYLHLEHRRQELLTELRSADAAAQAAVADLLVQPDDGVPFTPVARALARLRGVDADAAFLLRTAVSMFLLPEVCDPDGSNEVCRAVNATVFLPFTLPAPGKLAFELEAQDGAGKMVWQQTLTQDTEIGDLRMARPVAKLPGKELADGTYTMVLRTRIDGAPPRARDPVLRWPFHVLRGYQARAEAAMAAVRGASDLTADDSALVRGLTQPVERCYFGAPFVVGSHAVEELSRLERALADRAAGKGLANGLGTELPLLFDDGSEAPLPCRLRRGGDGARPLVVFVSGTPTYDLTARRPTAPAVREPGWLQHEMGEFGRAEGWHLAFVGSPGGGRNFGPALVEVLPWLQRRVDTGGRLPVLVVEREAASVAGLRCRELTKVVSALVLVGGGGVPGPAIDALGTVPLRFVRLHGVPAGDGLQRSLDHARLRAAELDPAPDVAWLTDGSPAWLFGSAAVAPALTAFVQQQLAR
ncbi:MAG: hypothetical protein MUC36_05210 [Planctomycetes bacterium]|nr:hypothetical protein [Planctomycetota bacterium]